MNSKPAALSSLLQSEAKYCHVLLGGSSATALKNTTKVTHHPLLCAQNPQKGRGVRAGRITQQLCQDTTPNVFPLRHRNFKYVIKQRCHCLTALDTPTLPQPLPSSQVLAEVQGQVPTLKSRLFQKPVLGRVIAPQAQPHPHPIPGGT